MNEAAMFSQHYLRGGAGERDTDTASSWFGTLTDIRTTEHESHHQYRFLGEVKDDSNDESFTIMATVLVVCILLFFVVCTYKSMRIWLCNNTNSSTTVLVHEGRVFDLSTNERRAALEAILSETSKDAMDQSATNIKKKGSSGSGENPHDETLHDDDSDDSDDSGRPFDDLEIPSPCSSNVGTELEKDAASCPSLASSSPDHKGRRSSMSTRRSSMNARRSSINSRRSSMNTRRSSINSRRSSMYSRRSSINTLETSGSCPLADNVSDMDDDDGFDFGREADHDITARESVPSRSSSSSVDSNSDSFFEGSSKDDVKPDHDDEESSRPKRRLSVSFDNMNNVEVEDQGSEPSPSRVTSKKKIRRRVPTAASVTSDEFTYDDGSTTEGNVCPICLCGYNQDDILVKSKHCSHCFHKSCLLEWLDKHDDCPCCRTAMVTDLELNQAASTLVGKTRMYRATASRRRSTGGMYRNPGAFI